MKELERLYLYDKKTIKYLTDIFEKRIEIDKGTQLSASDIPEIGDLVITELVGPDRIPIGKNDAGLEIKRHRFDYKRHHENKKESGEVVWLKNGEVPSEFYLDSRFEFEPSQS